MAGLPESLESQNLMNCNEEGLRNSGEETIQVNTKKETDVLAESGALVNDLMESENLMNCNDGLGNPAEETILVNTKKVADLLSENASIEDLMESGENLVNITEGLENTVDEKENTKKIADLFLENGNSIENFIDSEENLVNCSDEVGTLGDGALKILHQDNGKTMGDLFPENGSEVDLINVSDGCMVAFDDGASSSIENLAMLNLGEVELQKTFGNYGAPTLREEYAKFFETFLPTHLKEDPLPIKVHCCKISSFEAKGQGVRWASEYLYSRCAPLKIMQWALRGVSEHLSYRDHLISDFEYHRSDFQDERRALAEKIKAETLDPLSLMHAVVTVVDNFCLRMQNPDVAGSSTRVVPSPMDDGWEGFIEHKLDTSSRGLYDISYHVMKNGRRTMEDKVVVFPALPYVFKVNPDLSYFGVFDGHQGIEAASYGAAQLHQFLIESLEKDTNVPAALKLAFKNLDYEFIKKCSSEKIRSGSTAVVVLVDKHNLYFAWVGDSQASIYFGDGKVKQVVSVHKPNRENEQTRVKELGGEVSELNGIFRVNGTLAVSRSIGDPEFKVCVIGDPEIVEIKRSELNEDYIVLASDGLWDAMNAVEVGAFINQLIIDNKDSAAAMVTSEKVAELLAQEAITRGSQDNIGIIVTFLKPISDLQSCISQRTSITPTEYEGTLGQHWDTYIGKPVAHTNGVALAAPTTSHKSKVTAASRPTKVASQKVSVPSKAVPPRPTGIIKLNSARADSRTVPTGATKKMETKPRPVGLVTLGKFVPVQKPGVPTTIKTKSILTATANLPAQFPQTQKVPIPKTISLPTKTVAPRPSTVKKGESSKSNSLTTATTAVIKKSETRPTGSAAVGGIVPRSGATKPTLKANPPARGISVTAQKPSIKAVFPVVPRPTITKKVDSTVNVHNSRTAVATGTINKIEITHKPTRSTALSGVVQKPGATTKPSLRVSAPSRPTQKFPVPKSIATHPTAKKNIQSDKPDSVVAVPSEEPCALSKPAGQ